MNYSKLFFFLLGRILFADICKFEKRACFLNETILTSRRKVHTHTHTKLLQDFILIQLPVLYIIPDENLTENASVSVKL